MGFLSRFEGKMEDAFEGVVDKMIDAPISPVQIAKKAEKQMRREKMVGAGKQYAPTLYTVLVNPDDDERLFGYYPTLAGETETYLAAKAADEGLVMDGQPLVRFIVDDELKSGKFDIIAEAVAAPVIKQLRAEEMQRYGISPSDAGFGAGRGDYDDFDGYVAPARQYAGARSHDDCAPAYDEPRSGRQPLPYVPENEIDYSIDYGEYTFDSAEFDDYRDRESGGGAARRPEAGDAAAAAAAAAAAPRTTAFAGGAGQAHPLGSSGGTSRATLLNTSENRAYTLAAMRLLIGRESTNDIVVQDINASRTHAELRLAHGASWVLTDLGSTNGTYVNGQPISSHELHDGDRITIGMTNFVFELS